MGGGRIDRCLLGHHPAYQPAHQSRTHSPGTTTIALAPSSSSPAIPTPPTVSVGIGHCQHSNHKQGSH